MSSGPSWSGPGAGYPPWSYQDSGGGPPPRYVCPSTNTCPTYHIATPVVNFQHQNISCSPSQPHEPPQVPPAAPQLSHQPYPLAVPPPSHFPSTQHGSLPDQIQPVQHGPPLDQIPPPHHGPPTGQFLPHQSAPLSGPPNINYTVPQHPFSEPSAPPPLPVSITVSAPIAFSPYPSPGPPPAPPSCPPPSQPFSTASSGYDWGPTPPQSTQFSPAVGPPQSVTHNQSWHEWDDQATAHRIAPNDHTRHSSRSSQDRNGGGTSDTFRDSRSREHTSRSRSKEKLHSSSYEDERDGLQRRYKDDRGYSKQNDDRWAERRSACRKKSRSPAAFPARNESRQCSPRRMIKGFYNRYERERFVDSRHKDDRGYPVKFSDSGRREKTDGQQIPRSPQETRHREPRQRSSPLRSSHEQDVRLRRSPGRHMRSSSRPSSPERKRWRPSRSPEKSHSRSPERRNIGNRRGERETLDKTCIDLEQAKLHITPDSELQKLDEEEPEEEGRASWVRSAPADLYYQRDESNPLILQATKKLKQLCDVFEEKLIKRAKRMREDKQKKREDTEQEYGQKTDGCVIACCNMLEEGENRNIQYTHKTKTTEYVACDKKEDLERGDQTSQSAAVEPVHNDPKQVSEECASTEETCHHQLNENEAVCVSETQMLKHKGKHRHRNKVDRQQSSENESSSDNSGCSDSDTTSSSDDEESEVDRISKELERKRNHPDRLHPELWFNDPGEMNDGPLCRCSLKAQRSGIRHGYYVGEDHLEPCDTWTNNVHRLHHYLITISPPTNFLIKTPTVISHDGHEFIFEGFSLMSHHPLEEVPTCRVIRFNIEYTILYIQEKIPDNFCIKELDLFYSYLFIELLELVDLNLHAMGDSGGCPRFHFMPRFVRKLPDNGKEILSMNEVLRYLMKNSGPLVQPEDLAQLLSMSQYQWQNYADQLKGMIVSCPGMKPCSIRVDQLDRDQLSEETINYPVIVHFGIRPPQLSYAGNPEYQKAWREYVKFRHLLANMPKPSFEDKRRLEGKENKLQEMRMTSKMKRDVTIAVSSHGFYRTGIMCDVVQHAMLLPVLVCHLRFHQSLEVLEQRIQYKFKNRFLLQLALTHPSYRENFGTNPDHARNSLTNCGIRQPEYGDRRIHYMNTRKRGINTLINIMSRFGRNLETESKITHNERLEFLGDAVVEFLTSIHLFHLFPSLEEGGLATYRAAIVQNQHLAVLAEKLGLDQFMLYAHGSDLCHDFELRHAMANCFEALMGAIFLDSGIEEADKVLSSTLFKDELVLHGIWVSYPPHPIQEQEPHGDRKWIKAFPILTKLAKFEESIGVQFQHIRLLARAFTDRSIGFNNLTLGSNQRLEFLGDTVLQLVSSEYLYRYFPEHHEGHLSLLRSSLVNNRTQAVVCDDLGMTSYAMYSHLKTELKTKDRADLLEAFLGALYIDRGLEHCQTFCQVCFFPRLHQFIMNQDWNDPKSKLQQCCLTLRTMDGGEPDIPIYKVIECKGPTNTRVYTVAVYFRGRRLAKASGHSIQQAEMNAAREALMNSKELFPQLDHQRRVIEKSVKIQGVKSDLSHKDRDKERNSHGVRREDDKRDRLREKDKFMEDKNFERSRIAERRGIRERDIPDLEQNWQVEKSKINRDRGKVNKNRDRTVVDRDKISEREIGEEVKDTDSRRYRCIEGDDRKCRGELKERKYRADESEERGYREEEENRRYRGDEREDRRCLGDEAEARRQNAEEGSRASLTDNRHQSYSKYKDAGDRDRYKSCIRARHSDTSHGEGNSKSVFFPRCEHNRKQTRSDW